MVHTAHAPTPPLARVDSAVCAPPPPLPRYPCIDLPPASHSLLTPRRLRASPGDGLGDEARRFAAKHGLGADAAAELEALLATPLRLFGPGHRQRLLDMWGIESRCPCRRASYG